MINSGSPSEDRLIGDLISAFAAGTLRICIISCEVRGNGTDHALDSFVDLGILFCCELSLFVSRCVLTGTLTCDNEDNEVVCLVDLAALNLLNAERILVDVVNGLLEISVERLDYFIAVSCIAELNDNDLIGINRRSLCLLADLA